MRKEVWALQTHSWSGEGFFTAQTGWGRPDAQGSRLLPSWWPRGYDRPVLRFLLRVALAAGEEEAAALGWVFPPAPGLRSGEARRRRKLVSDLSFLFADRWNTSLWFSFSVALNFLAMEDINRDKIQDVLFLYKNTNGSDRSNQSCASEGFSAPCTFAAAVSGASGSVLWERAVAQDVALVECSVLQLDGSGASSACVLVDVSGAFAALDPFTGDTLWSRPSSLGTNASVLGPVLRVPDGDGDGTPDLLVLTREEKEVGVRLYSGSSGLQIGRRGSLGREGTGGPLLRVTRTGAHYLLFPCASALCGRSVKHLYEEVTGRPNLLKTDPVWERRVNASAPRTPLHSSGAIQSLMTVPGKTGDDLLLVGSEACVLLDGQELTPTWAFGATQVLRKPTFGHFTPDVGAVAIENGTGIDRQIWLLDLSTGAVLWSQPLPGLPGDPPSASLLTADHRSAFFFWGLHDGENQTEAGGTQHRLYMFHPTLPHVLLELTNVSANIVAFDMVLFEQSRHAACILLTGPMGPEAPGLVSVTKQKVKDLVPGSRVFRLGTGGSDSDEATRDRFSRLRYLSGA